MKQKRTTDAKSGRSAIIFNCVAMSQHGVVLLMMGPLLPEMLLSFQIGEGMAGLMLSIGSLGFMAGPLIAGTMIDRRGVRSAFAIGASLEIVFLLVFGLSPVFWLAIAAYFLTRFGASFIETGANVLPSLLESRKSAHSLMNFVHLFFSFGAFVGPILIGMYLNAFGAWRPVFGFMIVPTAALLLYVALTPLPKNRTDSKSSGGLNVRSALRSRVTVGGAFSLFCYVGAEVGISVWIVLYLQRLIGVSALVSSTGLSTLWICIMIGRYLNSLLGNRFSAAVLVAVSGVGGCIAVVAMLFTNNIVIIFCLLGLIGICLSGVFPNVMAEVNKRDPKRIGSVTAVMTIGAAAGAAVFMWAMGIIAEAFGLKIAFIVPAVLQLLEVGCFLIGIHVRKKSC